MQQAYPQLPFFADPAEGIPHTQAIGPEQQWAFDGLGIESRRTAGHSPGGLSYLISGARQPMMVVGDALFAGSIGGIREGSYAEALEHIRHQILSLPEDTRLLPGHGPASTVGEERRSNPFFP